MKTLEAVIACILLLVFLVEVMPRTLEKEDATPTDILVMEDTIVKSLSTNLRDEVLREDNESVRMFLSSTVRDDLDFNFTITSLESELVLPKLPLDRSVYTKTVIIGANLTENNPKLVRIYLWRR